jgi:hypothetical protein
VSKLEDKGTGELAMWITDDDPPQKIKWWREEEVPRLFRESAEAAGVRIGPISFYELAPGEDRAGWPPDCVQGINVRLLVAEADIIGLAHVQAGPKPFSMDLSYPDLQKLRSATRRAYGRVLAADGKTWRPMTDVECDKIIDMMGPEVAAMEACGATRH